MGGESVEDKRVYQFGTSKGWGISKMVY